MAECRLSNTFSSIMASQHLPAANKYLIKHNSGSFAVICRAEPCNVGHNLLKKLRSRSDKAGYLSDGRRGACFIDDPASRWWNKAVRKGFTQGWISSHSHISAEWRLIKALSSDPACPRVIFDLGNGWVSLWENRLYFWAVSTGNQVKVVF